METTSAVKTHSLTFTDTRSYLITGAFVAANVIFPYILHQIGLAGPIFLPLYFFSLVAGLLFGLKCGIVTGVVSPLISFLISGMPPMIVLPYVILKSGLLGGISGYITEKKVMKQGIFAVAFASIAASQILGSLVIFVLTQNGPMAMADFVVGYPGLLLQMLGAPLVSKGLAKYL